tara:strand:+ start:465 stop:1058 length:594 start_codon:yes stop_codon:yes gene_type:complete
MRKNHTLEEFSKIIVFRGVGNSPIEGKRSTLVEHSPAILPRNSFPLFDFFSFFFCWHKVTPWFVFSISVHDLSLNILLPFFGAATAFYPRHSRANFSFSPLGDSLDSKSTDNCSIPNSLKRVGSFYFKMSEVSGSKTSGYLQKRGEKGIVKGYKKRWFVFNADDSEKRMFYYQTRDDLVKDLGYISLNSVVGMYLLK